MVYTPQMPVRRNGGSAIRQYLTGVNEGVASFLGAIDGYDACWNEARVPNQVRTQFFENLVSVAACGTGDVSGDSATRRLTDGEMDAPLDQIRKRSASRRDSACGE